MNWGQRGNCDSNGYNNYQYVCKLHIIDVYC
jgi:hypothetical protein